MVDKEVAREIQAAIEGGDAERVAALIGSDKDRLNMSTRLFGTWLHVAASLGQLEIVKRLVNLGADVNALGGLEGSAPLHLAAAAGHLDIARYLLSRGATLDVSAPEKNPLFGAIHGGYKEMVKLLLDAGIDTKVRYQGRSIKNMDALAFARERGQSGIEQMLLSHKK
jgi:ankyrin repeat protein